MVDFVELYYTLTVASFLALLEEIIIFIILEKDDAGWKLRFSSVEHYTNLRPLIATWKAAFIIFLITLVVLPVFGSLAWDYLVGTVKTLEYNFLLLISGLISTFVWIWHYTIGKGWNIQQGLLLISSLIILGILIWINYL